MLSPLFSYNLNQLDKILDSYVIYLIKSKKKSIYIHCFILYPKCILLILTHFADNGFWNSCNPIHSIFVTHFSTVYCFFRVTRKIPHRVLEVSIHYCKCLLIQSDNSFSFIAPSAIAIKVSASSPSLSDIVYPFHLSSSCTTIAPMRLFPSRKA